MFACCTLAPVGHRTTDSNNAQRGRANTNAVGRVIITSPAATAELQELGKPRRSGSVLSPTNRRSSACVQSPIVVQVGTGLAVERLAAVRPAESIRSFPTTRRLRRPSTATQREGSRSTRVASIVVPPILPGRNVRDGLSSPSRGSPVAPTLSLKRTLDARKEESHVHSGPEPPLDTQEEEAEGSEDLEGPISTFRPTSDFRVSPATCCWRPTLIETTKEQVIVAESDQPAKLTMSVPAEASPAEEGEEEDRLSPPGVCEMLPTTRLLTPASSAMNESTVLDVIPEAGSISRESSASSDSTEVMSPDISAVTIEPPEPEPAEPELDPDPPERVQGRMRTRMALDTGTNASEKATARKASLSAKPSPDDTPLANSNQASTKPATKKKAKAPPGAKSAGAVGGLVTKDKNKMVDLLPPKDKKHLLGACTFVRNTIDVEPAADGTVPDRDRAFLFWLFLFAVKASVSGKQHPVATVCAHASDHAAGDLVTDKAKKAAPKVHFLIKAICKPVLTQLETPDPKLSAEEVAGDIVRSIGVLMGEKPAGWKDRLGFVKSAVTTWSWQKAASLAEANAADFDKYAEMVWDALDGSRQPGQTGFLKPTQDIIDLFQR